LPAKRNIIPKAVTSSNGARVVPVAASRLARFRRMLLAEAQRKRAAVNAQAVGIEIVGEDPATGALYLKDAVEKYLREIEMNRARSAFIHYRHTLDLFKPSCRKVLGVNLEGQKEVLGLIPSTQVGQVQRL